MNERGKNKERKRKYQAANQQGNALRVAHIHVKEKAINIKERVERDVKPRHASRIKLDRDIIISVCHSVVIHVALSFCDDSDIISLSAIRLLFMSHTSRSSPSSAAILSLCHLLFRLLLLLLLLQQLLQQRQRMQLERPMAISLCYDTTR